MAQLVEYNLAKVGVAGSSPVSRFIHLEKKDFPLLEDSFLLYKGENIMVFQWEVGSSGICITKVDKPERIVVIPSEIKGIKVVELGSYCFANTEVEHVFLSEHIEKIGAYAFYNCDHLKRMQFGKQVKDLGTGLFAGCKGPEFISIDIEEEGKSCLKELIADLRQTVRVEINGKQEARLIFPEYYEEAVEHTPARILYNDMHGSGHRYRYCFHQQIFQYHDYDHLFSYMKKLDQEELAVELAIGRIQYPKGLRVPYKEMYERYLEENWKIAGKLLVKVQCQEKENTTILEKGLLPWFVKNYIKESDQLDFLMEETRRMGDVTDTMWLMDYNFNSQVGNKRKRRFSL